MGFSQEIMGDLGFVYNFHFYISTVVMKVYPKKSQHQSQPASLLKFQFKSTLNVPWLGSWHQIISISFKPPERQSEISHGEVRISVL